MRNPRRVTAAVGTVAAAVILATVALAGCGGDAGAARSGGTRTVELDVRYSRFSPDVVTVPAGTTVRFVVRNGDPIDHELIVGPADVHERHETGTHAVHGEVPGEVSVPAGATGETSYRFDDPGTVVFACHLPGHLAYGMDGEVRVVG